MSTRSATIILQEQEKYRRGTDGYLAKVGYEDVEVGRFYRHCDGYPEGHGLHMAFSFEGCDKEHIDGRNWFQQYMGAFMTGQNLEGTPFEEWGAPRIEFEPVGCEHGDLEFLYTVTGSFKGEVEIAVYRVGWDDRYEDALKNEPLFVGTPAEYIAEFVKEA